MLQFQIIDRKLRRLLGLVDEVIRPDRGVAFAMPCNPFPGFHIEIREFGIVLHFKCGVAAASAGRQTVAEDQTDSVLLGDRGDFVEVLQAFRDEFAKFVQILAVEDPWIGADPVADGVCVPFMEGFQVLFGQRIRRAVHAAENGGVADAVRVFADMAGSVFAERLEDPEGGQVEFRRSEVVLGSEEKHGFGDAGVEFGKEGDFARGVLVSAGILFPVNRIPRVPGVVPDGVSGFRVFVRNGEADAAAGAVLFILFPAVAAETDDECHIFSRMSGKVDWNFRVVASPAFVFFDIQPNVITSLDSVMRNSRVRFPCFFRCDFRCESGCKSGDGGEQGCQNKCFFHDQRPPFFPLSPPLQKYCSAEVPCERGMAECALPSTWPSK